MPDQVRHDERDAEELEMIGMIMMLATPLSELCAAGGPIGENECWTREIDKADADLNIVWSKVGEAARNSDKIFEPTPRRDKPSAESDLLKAQRIWISWRDAECSARSDWAQGGSGQSPLFGQCVYRLTRERIDQLQELLTSYTVP